MLIIAPDVFQLVREEIPLHSWHESIELVPVSGVKKKLNKLKTLE